MTKPIHKKNQSEPAAVATRPLYWGLLLAILVLGLLSKAYRISYPQHYYFDEVYHGFTATQYLQGDHQTYDPWAKSPPERAYEWTHPPLAKLLMAGSMAVTGQNSFGWRIGSALFGTGAVAVTALLAVELFGSWPIALLAAFFMSIEGLAFAQSRIAMNDAYFIFFALLSMLFYARWKKRGSLPALYGAGIGLGLALATKWTALYLFVIIAIDLMRDVYKDSIVRRRLPLTKLVVVFGAVPALVYLGSYLHFFIIGNSWSQFVTLQDQMWSYHNGLQATHSYQSQPWQWILNLKPVWMFFNSPKAGLVENIYSFGNSVILITGFVTVGLFLFKKKFSSWSRWFVLLCYFTLWVPWCFSPRMMLFYHYLPAIPFLCIVLSRFLVGLFEDGGSRKAIAISIVAASALWFTISYPHLTGLAVPETFANRVYFALPSWK